jgi:hypothetical protein
MAARVQCTHYEFTKKPRLIHSKVPMRTNTSGSGLFIAVNRDI